MAWRVLIGLLVALIPASRALQNGAALTPPMSWLSWQRYRCAIGCNDSTSSECFNEKLIKDTADALVSEGYKDAGYEYVCLDDCWMAPRRENGHVVADPNRFPSGVKGLADYVHSKGLKLGLYTAVGNNTCAASKFAIDAVGLGCNYDAIPQCDVAKRDLEDYVSWGIDHLKVDGCDGLDLAQMNKSYDIIGRYLHDAAVRRGNGPVAYHPSFLGFSFPRQFRELASIGNQWRFFNDIQASWGSLSAAIEMIGAGQPDCLPGPLPANCTDPPFLMGAKSTWCASHCVEREAFLSVAGRGGWHDPDMLLIGNTPCSDAAKKDGMSCNSLTHDEEKTNMAIWSMSSAPMQISVDVKAVPAASKAILQNKEIIAIDQDPLGRMAFRFSNDPDSGLQAWRKELLGGGVAVALVNMGSAPGGLSKAGFDFRDVGFAPDTRVRVRDLFAQKDLGVFTGSFSSGEGIPPHGVQMLRLAYEPKYGGGGGGAGDEGEL